LSKRPDHSGRAQLDPGEQYRLLFENFEQGMAIAELVTAPDGTASDVIYRQVNASFERQSGLSDVVGRSASALLPNSDQSWLQAHARVAATGTPEHYEIFLEDTARHYRVGIQRIGETGSAILGVVFEDISAEVDARRNQELLLAELQHRVRNSLGVIRLIARRSAEGSESVEDYEGKFLSRLEAFFRVQSAVARDPHAGLDLAMIVAEELRAFGGREGDALAIGGPSVSLRPRAAERLGLAIHELATNAMKYGAISAAEGRLSVTWSLGPDTLDLIWEETGLHGIIEPEHRGFGTEVIDRTLTYDLGATTRLEYRDRGLYCEISVPRSEL